MLASTRILLRRLRCPVSILAVLVVLACAPKPDPVEEAAFTPDELYLIEAYTGIRRAQWRFPTDPVSAESLFVLLEAGIDTVRVNRTVDELNRTPRRWGKVFEEIQDRLNKTERERELEETGS
jgi:hypothetical protein